MIQSIVIEELIEEEKETVQKLLVESYHQYKHLFTSEEFWDSYVKGMVESVNSPHVDKILVAKHGEQIIGTVQLFETAQNAYVEMEVPIIAPFIRLLAVHPKARGLGIAQELLTSSLRYGKEKGANAVYLFTGDVMEKAVQLYERFGFKRDYQYEVENEEGVVRCYRYDL